MLGFSRYRVARLIQGGEHTEVFEAWALGPGAETRVALKRLLPDYDGAEKFLGAFAHEAESFRSVHASGVVRVVDHGLLDELPFLAIEYIDGCDLAELCERIGRGAGLRPAVSLWIARSVAAALQSLHAERTIHRDVREESVLIARSGEIRLGEPVLARARRRAEAPSVLLSRPDLEVDPVADVRALGAMLLRMLWLDTSGGVAQDALAIVRRAAQESRDRWYATAAEMVTDIDLALAQRGVAGMPPELPALMEAAVPLEPPLGTELFAVEALHPESYLELADRRRLRRFRSTVPEQLDLGGAELALGGFMAVTDPAPPAVKERGAKPNDPLLGTVLAGHQLVELLGRGSVARVYRGVSPEGAEYAVKVLDSKTIRYETSAKRMAREAIVLRDLNHPNLVAVHDSGVTEAGQPYLVLELLRGATLRELIGKRARPLSPWDAADITMQMASGLGAAHQAGLVHRDLKPSNVMLLEHDDSLTVKILDFGLARTLAPSAEQQAIGTLTGANSFVGTPKYIAPEQILGASQAGPPADLYSLGVILYEMLSGQPPFKGTMAEILQQQLHQPPPPLPPSAGLERVAAKLLVKDPEGRYASAEEVIEAIRALAIEPEPPKEPEPPVMLPPPPARTDPSVATPGLLPSSDLPSIASMVSLPPVERPEQSSVLGYVAVIGLAIATALLAWFLLRG